MQKFELTFTDTNNVLRVNTKKDASKPGNMVIELAVHDKSEGGRPNEINLSHLEVRMLANHLLCLIRE